jgi:hypothetical protein
MGNNIYSISPLPFYDTLDLQNHKKEYAYGIITPLIMPNNYIIPFLFFVDKSIITISNVYLVSNKDNSKIDYTSILNITIDTSDTDFNKIIYNPVDSLLTDNIDEGLYYLEIDTNSTIFYSDIFNLTSHTNELLKIEYYNSTNFTTSFGIISFDNSFKFVVFIPSTIGRPEYNFEEESTERNGYTYIEHQVSSKIYKFTFLSSEYLLDAVRLIRMCDNKKITYQSQVYQMYTFSITSKWLDDGYIAQVDASFETDNIISK